MVFGAKGGYVVYCPDRSTSPFPVPTEEDLAVLFSELCLPLPEPEEPEYIPEPSAPSVDEMEAAGTLKRGSAIEPPYEESRMPVTDDGSEYPYVWRGGQANHYEVQCPAHGRKRMERRGVNWACAGGSTNKPCQLSVPHALLDRVIAATLALGGE